MTKQLLINLPTANREASIDFFKALGLPLNEALTDENATCFNLEDNIVIALLPTEHFKETIHGNAVAKPGTNETQLAIGLSSREAVDSLLNRAIEAGGAEMHERVDMPGIYGGTVKDLDGHLWNVFHMS